MRPHQDREDSGDRGDRGRCPCDKIGEQRAGWLPGILLRFPQVMNFWCVRLFLRMIAVFLCLSFCRGVRLPACQPLRFCLLLSFFLSLSVSYKTLGTGCVEFIVYYTIYGVPKYASSLCARTRVNFVKYLIFVVSFFLKRCFHI